MSSTFKQFRDLHRSDDLFILPNAWDVKSALVFQEKKFPAIATSSSAVANSLGYEDGEKMSFDEYLFIIKRIISAVDIPISVDIETGYAADAEKIYSNIQSLADLGVAGINIEDSQITSAGRSLKDANSFAKMIGIVKNKLTSINSELFINIRCDTFILNVDNKMEETNKRLKLYETTGADGIFLPCITAENDIAEAVRNTRLPLNVMCFPGLPGFDVLNKLGVKRVSMGPFLFNKIYQTVAGLAESVIENKSFTAIL